MTSASQALCGARGRPRGDWDLEFAPALIWRNVISGHGMGLRSPKLRRAIHRPSPLGSEMTIRPRTGESLAQMGSRVRRFMDRLAGSTSGSTIAVTHGGFIKIAVLALGAPLRAMWQIDCEPLSITQFVHGSRSLRVLRVRVHRTARPREPEVSAARNHATITASRSANPS